jgi:dienelactone hydrolase
LANGQAPEKARPLWGTLPPGPFDVGFRVLYSLDRSRVWGPTPHSALAGEFARPVRISLWYPAQRNATAARMRYREYIEFAAPDPYFARLDGLLEARDTTSLREMFAGAEGYYSDALALPMAARRNAPPARQRFPLVMYSQGWNSSHQSDNVVLAEFLASNGYVVAAVPQVGETVSDLTLQINPVDLETQMRDVEFATGVAQMLPFVDRRKIALMGWSMGGVVSLWIAGRNPKIDAVVGLDASFRAHTFVNLAIGSPYFDIRRLRAPLLALQSGNTKYTPGQDDRVVDSMHFAERFVGRVADITHGDFSDFPMLARLFPVAILDRTADQASRGHETVCRVVRVFLDGVLKEEGGPALTMLRSAEFNGLTLTRHEAAAIPSEEDFVAMAARDGVPQAVTQLKQLQVAHPELVIIRYAAMTRLGYRLLHQGRPDSAIDAFRLNTEAYPTSADGFDSLADGYLAKADSGLALQAYERVLELLPGDSTLDAGAREELRGRATARVRTLRAPP